MKRTRLLLGASVACAVLGCASDPAQPGGAVGGATSGAGSGVTGGSGTASGGAPSLAGTPATGGASASSGAADGGDSSSGSGGTLPQAGAPGASPNPPLAGGGAGGAVATLPKRVLLYHFSTLDIPSVPAQLTFFQNKLSEWHYESDDSVDPAQLTDQNLDRYAAVAMINTCFEPFGKGKPDRPQSEVLQRFLQRGGGLFGTHCASVTFQTDTPPALYNQIIGGRGGDGFFDGTSDCRTLATHPTTSALSAQFSFVGNLDNTDFLAADSVVLVKCKWQGTAGKDVNVSWYRNEGLGRVFYTDFAKLDADLNSTALGPHIGAGLAWVLGIVTEARAAAVAGTRVASPRHLDG